MIEYSQEAMDQALALAREDPILEALSDDECRVIAQDVIATMRMGLLFQLNPLTKRIKPVAWLSLDVARGLVGLPAITIDDMG